MKRASPLIQKGPWPELVCPEDHLPLTWHSERWTCPKGHSWVVKNDIPVMVSEENNYADAFGLQWLRYRQTQLDSYTKIPISFERARRCIGTACWQLMDARPLDVLEVGCGAGRFTEVLLAPRCTRVTSVDFSVAVEANVKNLPQNDRHRVLRADALNLPFKPAQFDLVFCLGVIQHTPDPESTIKQLYEQVKPGGYLVFDNYAHTLSFYTKLATLLRLVLKRLPPESGLKWTERVVNALFPLHKAVRNARPLQMLLSRVSPVISYFHAYPTLSDQLQYEWALLDTHDSLTDHFKHLRTRGQLQECLVELGALEIWCVDHGSNIEARCRKPLAPEGAGS
jgi:SAM-dependent methyltransferase